MVNEYYVRESLIFSALGFILLTSRKDCFFIYLILSSVTAFIASTCNFMSLLCKLCDVLFSPDMCEHSLNLGDLINDVAVISAKWRLVGVQLNLPNGTLDEIQTQNAGKPDQCILSFEQVFATWRSLGTSPYTWKTLINALRSPGVGEVTLANELNVKYCSLPDMDL